MFKQKIILGLLILGTLSACESPSALVATRTNSSTQSLRANLSSSQAGQLVQITEPQNLPESIRSSKSLKVSFDNTDSTSVVTRNADGTLSFTVPTTITIESDGSFNVILIAEDNSSQLIRLETGPLIKLQSPGITVAPAQSVTKGTALTLQANLQTEDSSKPFDYNWFYSNSNTGPWQVISGSQAQTQWEPPAVGSFFIRLDIQDQNITSSHISPTPIVTVKDSDNIAIITSGSGLIRQGERVQLKANLPELQGQYTYNWAVSQSPQGPFQPLPATGESISWEADFPGQYYVRIKATNDKQSTTYISSKSLISVSDSDDLFKINPGSGNIIRGEALTLSAAIPNAPNNLSYNWFFSPSRQIPFAPIEGQTSSIQWRPNTTGEFLVQLKTFNPDTKESRTYNTSKAIVSVQDSDQTFQVSQSSITKGESVKLQLNRPVANEVLWSFATSPQGLFTPIPGQGTALEWTPPLAGSFYLKAEVVNADKSLSTFASATALLTVGENSNVIRNLSSSRINLGDTAQLAVEVPNNQEELRYAWSYSQAATGPWTALEAQSNQNLKKTLSWIPAQAGSFFIKVDAIKPSNQSVVSFVSPTPLIFVDETISFFKTNPSPANTSLNGAVNLETNFQPHDRSYIYSWSYAATSAGPFVAIGGSLQPRMTWKRPGAAGNFYIKFDAVDQTTKQVTSFTSRVPLVFVTGSTTPTTFTF